ncbi:conserved phage C-terminal domain-containing protein [Clostridium baratii]
MSFERYEKKYYEWKDTEYEKYLRPSTLFNDDRFDE